MKWLVVLQTVNGGKIRTKLEQGEVIAVHESYVDEDSFELAGYDICVVETMDDEVPMYRDDNSIKVYKAHEWSEYKMPKYGRLNSISSWELATTMEKRTMDYLMVHYNGCVDEMEKNGRFCRDRILQYKEHAFDYDDRLGEI